MSHIPRLLWSCLPMLLLAACGGGGGSGASPPMIIVTAAPAVSSVMVGQQLQLGATTRDAMGNVLTGHVVTWASSNTAVATVDSSGLVKALALGQVTITATSDGQSGMASVTTVQGISFATVSAGGNHTCGLTSSGAAYCWGKNSSGQLGNGTMNNSATPMPVAGGHRFVSVTAGDNHTCGVATTRDLPINLPFPVAPGAAYCWGDNTFGQLGDGTITSSAKPVLVAFGYNFGFDTVSAGGRHTCGVAGGGLFCWGDNSSGQLGNGTLTNSAVPVITTGVAPDGSGPHRWNRVVSAGNSHTCAVAHEAGFVGTPVPYCWGDNSSGQLGNGTMTNSAVPVQVLVLGVEISAGMFHSCLREFSVSCWGNNDAGQLGNGTTASSTKPVSLSGGLSFASVSTGARHACGPVSDTTMGIASLAYCWGDNTSGQLGNGTRTNSAIPIVVAGGLSFATVSAGGRHTCGVLGLSPPDPRFLSASAVYCWGDNAFGQLGNTWTTSSTVPVNVAGQP